MAIKKIDINKQVTAKARMIPSDNPLYHGFAMGKLDSVEVEIREIPKIKEDGSTSDWEMAGKTIPILKLNFSNTEVKEEQERIFLHTEDVIGINKSVANGGGPIDDKTLDNLYTQMWNRLKHFHEVYAKQVNFKELGKEMADTVNAWTTNAGNASKTVDSTIKCFTDLFNAFANAMNKGKDGKPVYVKADNTSCKLYMKLVGNYSNVADKAGKFFTFPTFVGSGMIEIYIPNVKPLMVFGKNEVNKLSAQRTIGQPSSIEKSEVPENVIAMLGLNK